MKVGLMQADGDGLGHLKEALMRTNQILLWS